MMLVESSNRVTIVVKKTINMRQGFDSAEKNQISCMLGHHSRQGIR